MAAARRPTRPSAELDPRASGRRERSATGIEAQPANGWASTSTCGPASRSLHDDGWVERGVEQLKKSGHVYEQDGALWFRSTAFGDDKDRVIFRSNGEPTYFASGHRLRRREVQPRLRRAHLHLGRRPPRHRRAAQERRRGAGLRPRRRQCAAHRLGALRASTAWRCRCPSARAISSTLDDLLDEVGVDAARWFFASRGTDHRHRLRHRAGAQAVEREPGLLRPVRARADLLRSCGRRPTKGVKAADSLAGRWTTTRLRSGWRRSCCDCPTSSLDAAAERETQAITAFATELATKFHAYYRDRRVVDTDDPQTSAARLALVDATRITLARALGLLGISAPESM